MQIYSGCEKSRVVKSDSTLRNDVEVQLFFIFLFFSFLAALWFVTTVSYKKHKPLVLCFKHIHNAFNWYYSHFCLK